MEKKTVRALMNTKPEGTSIKYFKLDHDKIFLQFIIDGDVPPDEIDDYTQNLRKNLPNNVLLVVTPPNVTYKVNRPRNIELNFKDSSFETKEMIDALKKAFNITPSGGAVKINFENCHFQKRGVKNEEKRTD